MKSDAIKHLEKHVASRAVPNFPKLYHGTLRATLQRVSSYWRARMNILRKHQPKNKHNGNYYVTATNAGIKRVMTNASPGRGRKNSHWTRASQEALILEFDCLHKTGIRFNRRILRTLALQLMHSNRNESFGANVFEPTSERCIYNHITSRCDLYFTQGRNIVCHT